MSDFKKFEYIDKPCIPTKNVDIRPLTDKGFFKDYLSKDSYVHNFLNKTTLCKMFQNENRKAATASSISEKRENLNRSAIITSNKNEENVPSSGNNSQNPNYMNDVNSNALLTRNRSESKIILLDSKKLNMNRSQPDLNINPNNSILPLFKKTNNMPVSLKSNKSVKLKKHLDNSRFNDDYNYRLKEVDKKLSTTSNSFYINKSLNYHHPYDGFESYKIPRFKSEITTTSTRNYTKRIARSVHSSSADYRSSRLEEVEGDKLKKENEKLRKILMNQSNSNFLSQGKLPKIRTITSQPKIKISLTGIGNSKHMGDKYNPYSFFGISKNWVARNYHGGLYQY